ncbi:MAG TPA: helix-turn-helix transcriptional regulator [Thermoanaerobaculia bacterium]|nr:helix-turn-helix transcriptional regulator [Thermoanaerobaculia bacterium]
MATTARGRSCTSSYRADKVYIDRKDCAGRRAHATIRYRARSARDEGSAVPRRQNISAQTRAVLAALSAAAEDWHYGYELCKSTGLKSGTLYPLLIRLHDQGLLEAEWRPAEVPGRPPRHAYRLTASGMALAAERDSDQSKDGAILRPARVR